MAELEPGHPDELCKMLINWLNQANDPVGTLPAGVTPTEWAVRNFIDSWRGPVRTGINVIEGSMRKALEALKAGNTTDAEFEIECSLQTLAETVRGELGLYEWNDDGT